MKMLSNFTLFILSLLLFLQGFFPLNQTDSSSQANLPTALKDAVFNVSELYSPETSKLILVVIDALRTDFIRKDLTPFLATNLGYEGCISEVQVETPTVTLPRIKAITSGRVPQFIDVVMNLASSEQLQDSVLHRAKKKGLKLVFYGDDTWLKLFPDVFNRSEGTSSFYVNDFTEVDDNVTRNLQFELQKNDWDIMILHYLGLDHIGHLSGPFSPLIPAKLHEMDRIVESIYEKIQSWNSSTLIMVTGDHGMKDSGGHGGATRSETRVPLVTLGMHCKGGNISQIDIAATIAVILGLEIPHTSIGTIATNLLLNFHYEKLLYILHYNLLHLRNKLNLCTEAFGDATELHYKLLKNLSTDPEQEIKQMYELCSNEISFALKKSSVQQDMPTLVMAFTALIHCLITLLYSLANSRLKHKNITYIIITVILLQFYWQMPELSLVFSCILWIYNLALIVDYSRKYKVKCDINIVLVLLTILHPISFLSSSFIEEEHQIWYYYGVGAMILSIFTTFKGRIERFKNAGLLVAFRFVRKLNQTGDKWAALPDFALFFKAEENFVYLTLLFVISLLLVCRYCLFLTKDIKWSKGLIILISVLILLFRGCKEDVLLGQLIWMLLLISCLLKNVLVTWLLMSALLLRPYNLVLLPFAVYASRNICRNVKSGNERAIFHLWLGNLLFFCQGHSNSLASVDVASGYVGLKQYQPILVLSQVLCHSYIFPILAYLLSSQQSHIFVLHRMLSVILISFMIILQRHHLFVWSVFAPKLLIEASHCSVLYFIVILKYISCKYSVMCLQKQK